jgi:hypothetical protein
MLTPALSLVVGVVALLAWLAVVLTVAAAPGAAHLLLALSATLLVRWWALTR